MEAKLHIQSDVENVMVATPVEERRRARRYELRLPVRLRLGRAQGAMAGVTTDISNSAAFVCLPEVNDEDYASPVEWVIKVPAELSLAPVQILCAGKVIRVCQGESGPVGLVVSIESYRFAQTSTAGESN